MISDFFYTHQRIQELIIIQGGEAYILQYNQGVGWDGVLCSVKSAYENPK